MSIFNRNQSDNTNIPEDLQPYYTADQPAWKSWLKRILIAIVGLALLALLTWAVVTAFQKFSGQDTDNNKSGNGSQQTSSEGQDNQNNKEGRSDEAGSTQSGTNGDSAADGGDRAGTGDGAGSTDEVLPGGSGQNQAEEQPPAAEGAPVALPATGG